MKRRTTAGKSGGRREAISKECLIDDGRKYHQDNETISKKRQYGAVAQKNLKIEAGGLGT